MADVLSALVGLSDGVRLWFGTVVPSLGVSVPPVGFRERSKKLNEGTGRANRVLFMPGIIATGDVPDIVDMGSIVRGHRQSFNPRTLFEWDLPFTMSVWAVDATDAASVNDEQKQLIAVTNLLELAMRAVHNAKIPENPGDPNSPQIVVGLANIVTPGKVRIVTKNRELNFGREVLVSFGIKTPLFDKTYDVATPAPNVNRHPITVP